MILGIDFIDNTLDNTFFIDDKSSAERSHISTAVQLFFGPYAECLIERRIGIGNQIERQRLFLDKFPMGSLAVFTYSYNFVTGCTQLVISVA